MLDTALKYLSLGWNVIPLQPRGKKPLFQWAEFQKRRATEEEIKEWWQKWPNANIGVVTGIVSGIIVLDVDVPEGRKSLENKELPPTICAHTGSGGFHYIFKHPGGEIRNFTRRLPGLDLRGDGGYIVAPPSIHPCGEIYKWGISPDTEKPVDPPEWLLDLLDAQSFQKETNSSSIDPKKVLAGVPEGERDITLFRYASSLRARGVKKEEAEALICIAAANCSPPFPEKEALAKVESAWKYPEGEEILQIACRAAEEITEENIFEEENLQTLALLAERMPAEFAKIKRKFKGIVNLNDLQRALKPYRSKKKILKIVTPDYVPPQDLFPDLPLSNITIPQDWNLTENGVWTYDAKKGAICACPVPVLIIERLQDITTEQEKIKLAFRRDGRWHYITADRATVFNHTAIIQLANQGMPINSVNAKDFVKFLAEFERENINNIPCLKSTQQMGWITNDTFFPYAEGEVIFNISDPNTESIVASYKTKGDLATWKKTIEPIRQYPIARFILAASFASPLLKLVNQRVFIIHTWGSSRGGKTATMKAALSVWGDPEALLMSFYATKTALERLAALFCDLPLGIDERQVMGDRQENIESLIYTLSGGKSKARATRSGGLQHFSVWKSIILTNGEHPLSAENSATGIKTRSLEIYGVPIPEEKVASDIHKNIGNAYGVAGAEYITKLIEMRKNNPEVVRIDYEKVLNQLETWLPEVMANYISYAAVVTLADIYSSVFIFGQKTEQAYTEALENTFEILKTLESKEEIDETDRALEYLYSWIYSNQGKFIYIEDTSIDAEIKPFVPNHEIYGFIENDYVFIYPSIFERALSDAKFNTRRITRDLAERGIIVTSEWKNGEQKKQRARVKKRDPISRKPTNYVQLLLENKDENSLRNKEENLVELDLF
ncbi:DUF927 domain-containing protein [Thermosyntropha sp.]|uniref:DUF927 domain-containing protein n=1 Tax=Thermosyntropha sp. TaxID=2740820 RepID=UPI0025E31B9D|nr:DUF927 domain-containing protein [Thermosyntropha sp.]MBO8158846.1 DUF927 domain-containing protein [Thermosyntropha sp.]